MRNKISSAAILLFAGICAWSCTNVLRKEENVAQVKVIEEEEEAELAPYMAELQRFSQKMGYAVQNQNEPLVRFYRREIEETLDEIYRYFPEENGLPLAQTAATIMEPLMQRLQESLDEKDWKKSAVNYSALINGCNRCHASMEVEFIKIIPAKGVPPFNQQF